MFLISLPDIIGLLPFLFCLTVVLPSICISDSLSSVIFLLWCVACLDEVDAKVPLAAWLVLLLYSYVESIDCIYETFFTTFLAGYLSLLV